MSIRNQKKMSGTTEPHKEIAVNRFDKAIIATINSDDLKFGKVLGRGGFGVVYKGLWKNGGDLCVAIKQMNHSFENDVLAWDQFEQEVLLMIKLRHPNVIQIFGVSFNQTYSIVMEFMENGSLDRWLKNNPKVGWETRRRMVQDTWSGLVYLHQQKIMHRDIKSGNVLLTKELHAKWTDFGISKNLEEQQTITKGQGTLPWTAPEIMRGERHYTEKADIYSYGILLWELATGQIPYQSMLNAFQLCENVIQGQRPPIPETMPDDLKQLMISCWDSEPEKRPNLSEMNVTEGIYYSPRGNSPTSQETPMTPKHGEGTEGRGQGGGGIGFPNTRNLIGGRNPHDPLQIN